MKAIVGLACTVLVLACPPSPAPDPLPEPPVIGKFTATPKAVARGETVTLSWETRDASEVEVVDLVRGAISAASNKLNGEVAVAVTQPTVFALYAKNTRGVRVSAVASVDVDGVEPASIIFAAYPPLLEPGKRGVLVWNAVGAKRLEIAPMGGAPLALGGQLTSGSIEINPTVAEITYVLTVDGQRRTATVVRTQEIVEAVSSVAQVKAQTALTLSWKTAYGTKLRITSPGRGVLKETTDATEAAMGSLTDMAPVQPNGTALNYFFELEGRGALQTRTLSVAYGDAPAVVSVSAPKYVKENLTFPLSWATVGADRVEIRDGPAVVYRTSSESAAASGSVRLPAPINSTEFSVVALSTQSGASASRTVRVTTVIDVGLPSLSAAPATIASGGTPVTLTWNAPGAVRTRVIENGETTVVAIEGPGATAGTATVYPNRSGSRYELFATNTLEPAQVVSAEVTVSVPAQMRSVDAGTVYQSQGSAALQWNVGTELLGFSTPSPVVTANSNGFVDISTTGNAVLLPAGTNDALAPVVVDDFETFLLNRRIETVVWVSTNGFLQFADDADQTRPVPRRIPSDDPRQVPENFVAAFWSDLELGPTGTIHWQIIGTAPFREFIVQWTNLRQKDRANSVLTFQAKISQSGAIALEYRTMTGVVNDASIGYQGPLGVGFSALGPPLADGGVTGALPAPMSRISFAGSLTSPATVSTAAAPGGGLVRIGTGALRLEYDEIVKPTDIIISEVMNLPSTAVRSGQWFEVANFSNTAVNFSGWQLTIPDAGTLMLGNAGILPPRGYIVVAQTTDPELNDELPNVSLAAPALNLPLSSTLTLSNAEGFVTTLSLSPDGGGPIPSPGVSLAVDRGPFVNRDARPTDPLSTGFCPSRPSQIYGNLSPSQQGTPGASGDGACMGYTMSSIPGKFRDIATTGSLVTMPSPDEAVAIIDISAAPTVLFGLLTTTLTVSTNGWLVPRSYSGPSNYINKVSPSLGVEPSGAVIAPFWSDLQLISGRSAIVRQRFSANEDPNEPRAHWIIQFSRVAVYPTDLDDLSFEVKLFDTGDIEYHYGALLSGNGLNFGNGNAATVWLEADDASRALAFSINRPLLRPNTGIRFTRIP
jgi:hypothetical protein